MLSARWTGPMCRNAAVSGRHHSPAATATGSWSSCAKRVEKLLSSGKKPSVAAPTAVTTNIATFSAMRLRVTAPHRRPAACRPLPRLTARTDARPSRTHSGHWKPTEAGIMHSGQIGRPQRAAGDAGRPVRVPVAGGGRGRRLVLGQLRCTSTDSITTSSTGCRCGRWGPSRWRRRRPGRPGRRPRRRSCACG